MNPVRPYRLSARTRYVCLSFSAPVAKANRLDQRDTLPPYWDLLMSGLKLLKPSRYTTAKSSRRLLQIESP